MPFQHSEGHPKLFPIVGNVSQANSLSVLQDTPRCRTMTQCLYHQNPSWGVNNSTATSYASIPIVNAPLSSCR